MPRVGLPIPASRLPSPFRQRSTADLLRGSSLATPLAIHPRHVEVVVYDLASETCVWEDLSSGRLGSGSGAKCRESRFGETPRHRRKCAEVRNRPVSMMGVYQPRQPPPIATAAPKSNGNSATELGRASHSLLGADRGRIEPLGNARFARAVGVGLPDRREPRRGRKRPSEAPKEKGTNRPHLSRPSSAEPNNPSTHHQRREPPNPADRVSSRMRQQGGHPLTHHQ